MDFGFFTFWDKGYADVNDSMWCSNWYYDMFFNCLDIEKILKWKRNRVKESQCLQIAFCK